MYYVSYKFLGKLRVIRRLYSHQDEMDIILVWLWYKKDKDNKNYGWMLDFGGLSLESHDIMLNVLFNSDQ